MHGTVTVWTMVIVVTGAEVGGEGLPEAVTRSPVAEGRGMRVMVSGTLVIIPGFSGTWGAQMPTKYERAAWIKLESSVQDETQSWTFLVNVESLQ